MGLRKAGALEGQRFANSGYRRSFRQLLKTFSKNEARLPVKIGDKACSRALRQPRVQKELEPAAVRVSRRGPGPIEEVSGARLDAAKWFSKVGHLIAS